MCGERELKGEALRILTKTPPSGGILFHEFGPRAPYRAWGLFKLINHQPSVDESCDDLAKEMNPSMVRCMRCLGSSGGCNGSW